MYQWIEEGKEPVDVISVTSIRKLCGEPLQLVQWQISNVLNVVLGTTKRVKIGPRGGRTETYVRDGEFPGIFLTKLLATEGTQAGLDALRKWLRETADKPRDTAAVRGTMVHEAIEIGATVDMIDRRYVELAVGRLSPRDQKKMAAGVTEEDVEFIRSCVAQYWDMRAKVPFVLLAREPQVWNLSQGYAGSADALIWFLPEAHRALPELQKMADRGEITQAFIEEVGGHVTLGDWKTSKGVYTDQVVQVHGYLMAEFVGADGTRDERLTEIIRAANEAAIIHIRPNKWAVHFVDFERPVALAFLGSVAFARFLAMYPQPFELFKKDLSGSAPDTLTEDPEDA